MKKEEQMRDNEICMLAYKNAMNEFHAGKVISEKRLRTCTAWVYETPNYFLLKSYDTIVAVISKETDVCYDVLRKVFGYTATSAKHIANFRSDYGQDKWGCKGFRIAR